MTESPLCQGDRYLTESPHVSDIVLKKPHHVSKNTHVTESPLPPETPHHAIKNAPSRDRIAPRPQKRPITSSPPLYVAEAPRPTPHAPSQQNRPMDHVTVPCPRKRPISKRPITSSRTTHSLVPESPHRDAPRQQNRPITSSPPLHVTESPHASKIAPSRNTISRALENAPLKTPHHVPSQNAQSRHRHRMTPHVSKIAPSRHHLPIT